MYESNIQQIAPGKVQLECGPISMVLSAFKDEKPLDDVLMDGCKFAIDNLGKISKDLEILKLPWTKSKLEDFGSIGQLMWNAVSRTEAINLTPMAAVAGTMSDITADYLEGYGGDKVFVNNGGDIAIRLGNGNSLKVGIISSLSHGVIEKTVEITEESKIGGVATSGFGGRSFTLGVADAITVFSKKCAQADSCATHLANVTYVDSPQVKQVKAGCLDPNSDIFDLNVTMSVGKLLKDEKEISFRNLSAEVEKQFSLENLVKVVGYIQEDRYVFQC